jgi:2-oxoisovalerate dehydrogenase E1 component beta subunit
MAADASVVVLGEDVGVNGGVFRATAGLAQRFGAERVLDTPCSICTIACRETPSFSARSV